MPEQKPTLEYATSAGCVIEMVPQVGQFVAAGDPLFRVFGQEGASPAHRLRGSIALGQERTLEQDPTLAFRIIVDIACKAVNGPLKITSGDPPTIPGDSERIGTVFSLAIGHGASPHLAL